MQPQIQIQQIKPALQNLEIKKDKITIADLK
jgi:predicted transposase YbfD/YdcC